MASEYAGSQVQEGQLVNALAIRGDEGRGTLRKAPGRREHPLIRRCPNGETHPFRVSCVESIGTRGKRGELKHLSNRRNGNQTRLR